MWKEQEMPPVCERTSRAPQHLGELSAMTCTQFLALAGPIWWACSPRNPAGNSGHLQSECRTMEKEEEGLVRNPVGWTLRGGMSPPGGLGPPTCCSPSPERGPESHTRHLPATSSTSLA